MLAKTSKGKDTISKLIAHLIAYGVNTGTDHITEHVKTAVDTGELTLEVASCGMSFRMLMEDSWSQEIVPELN
ncbi:hypothetical protein D791_01271 [Nitrincola nitratireducens]|uniref:Uncharacterized protein n=1 Tax=Nitrincola nitratireducens TaxID=1229521 RepID=W9UXD3_9GAMM|nr:hypothetical protein D791_01271 [Nitrincola nitratireducens]